jgi:nucleoside-diphosphate-sugar epimerase
VGRIFITGGSGFIGTNLIESYLQDGWEVMNFDWASPRNPRHNGLLNKGDILNRDGLSAAVRDFQPELVVHLAARTDLNGATLKEYDANTIGVQNMIEAIRETRTVNRAVFASSRYVHRTEVFPLQDDDYSPFTLYGKSKVETEKLVRSSKLEIPWALIRPTSIWGPWFRIPYRMFFDTVRRGLYVHPTGRRISKSYGYIGNVVYQIRQLLSAESSKVDKRTFYVSDDHNIEVLEFAQVIQQAFGAPQVRQVPMSVLRALAYVGDALKRMGVSNPPLTSFRLGNLLTPMNYDMTATREVTGAAPYSLHEGVGATVDWMLHHG